MSRVIAGLERIAGGDYEVRMPLFRGKEGRLISEAFNHAAQSVAEATEARRQAGEASSKLQMSRDLTREITSHIEEERRSIARELHDELGQSITAIKSVGAALARRAPKDDPVIGAHVQMIIDAADRMYDAVHEMIPRLRPMSLDSFGLSAALSDLVSEWRHRRPEIHFQLAVNEDLPPLEESLSTTAYRIAQESVINAVRHASPGMITVSACIENDRLLLQITDDGKGLDPDWERSGHFGVLGMRERAIALGGSCELTRNDAGTGTTVTARLPLLQKH
jgi:two-component system sensor histidine kinase UhpB